MFSFGRSYCSEIALGCCIYIQPQGNEEELEQKQQLYPLHQLPAFFLAVRQVLKFLVVQSGIGSQPTPPSKQL